MSRAVVEEGVRMLRKEMKRNPTETAASSRRYCRITRSHRVLQVTCWFYQIIYPG